MAQLETQQVCDILAILLTLYNKHSQAHKALSQWLPELGEVLGFTVLHHGILSNKQKCHCANKHHLDLVGK